MVNILETLQAQREEISAQIKSLKKEMAKVDAAILAVNSMDDSTSPKVLTYTSKMTINQAIVEAVKNGSSTPKEILAFLEDHLAMSTTINSVRTRVSRLSSEKKIVKSNKGWVTPKEKPSGSGPESSKVTGEGHTSPNDGPKP